jgi:hypothetical protein
MPSKLPTELDSEMYLFTVTAPMRTIILGGVNFTSPFVVNAERLERMITYLIEQDKQFRVDRISSVLQPVTAKVRLSPRAVAGHEHTF